MELSPMCRAEFLMPHQSIKYCVTPDFKKENFYSQGKTQAQVNLMFLFFKH